MPHRLLHHDLLAVPLWGDKPVIFWLRLYESLGGYVAVVTEVPGNPSATVTNCMSGIAHYVQRQFAIPPGGLVLYEVWPRGSPPVQDTQIRRVSLGHELGWEDASRAEIEALIEAVLPELPPHDELYRRVVALGGGVIQEVVRPLFEAVPIDRLPPFHNPARCEHHERFEHMTAEQEPNSKAHWFDTDLTTGKAFLASLSARDLRRCYYHQARWKDIADESVRIIETLGRQDPDDYLAAVGQSRLRRKDRSWLGSLFADPIVIGERSYTNGQHRGCALRFSGAARAAVVTGDEHLGEECTDWTYEGGG